MSDNLPALSNPVGAATKESSVAVAKGIIGAVPFAGTFLNEAIFEVRSRLKQQRLEKLVHALAAKIEQLGESSVSQDTIKSPEFSDLLETIIEKVTRTRSKEKLRLFADILSNSMRSGSLSDIDDRELFTTVLSTLSENEIIILRHLATYAEAVERRAKMGQELEITPIDYGADAQFGVPIASFKVCFETLISKGLAFDDSFGRFDTKARTFIKPTPLAVALVQFVKSCETEPA